MPIYTKEQSNTSLQEYIGSLKRNGIYKGYMFDIEIPNMPTDGKYYVFDVTIPDISITTVPVKYQHKTIDMPTGIDMHNEVDLSIICDRNAFFYYLMKQKMEETVTHNFAKSNTYQINYKDYYALKFDTSLFLLDWRVKNPTNTKSESKSGFLGVIQDKLSAKGREMEKWWKGGIKEESVPEFTPWVISEFKFINSYIKHISGVTLSQSHDGATVFTVKLGFDHMAYKYQFTGDMLEAEGGTIKKKTLAEQLASKGTDFLVNKAENAVMGKAANLGNNLAGNITKNIKWF